MLVLRPKGRFRISGRHEVRSQLGLSRLEAEWKPVELWTLPAEQFLAQADVGVTPWVPLMHFDGPPEALLERCAEKIEREAHPKDQADLLAVSQVLGELKYSLPILAEIFGGQKTMFESPMLTKMIAQRYHKTIGRVLKARFNSVPRDVTRLLGEILDEEKLSDLTVLAAQCPDPQTFREALLS